MNDGTQELGTLAPVHTETPENDPLLEKLETAPEDTQLHDVETYRRNLESVQDIFFAQGKDFTGENVALTQALAQAFTEKELKGEIDNLTSLLNRNGFDRVLRDYVGMAQREKYPLTIMTLDANGLKQINDTQGHKAGDEYLKRVAECMVTVRRLGDVMARVGGDEYHILLPATTTSDAMNLWERLNGEFEKQGISISAGVADVDLNNPKDSINSADMLMYEAKKESKSKGANVIHSLETLAEERKAE